MEYSLFAFNRLNNLILSIPYIETAFGDAAGVKVLVALFAILAVMMRKVLVPLSMIPIALLVYPPVTGLFLLMKHKTALAYGVLWIAMLPVAVVIYPFYAIIIILVKLLAFCISPMRRLRQSSSSTSRPRTSASSLEGVEVDESTTPSRSLSDPEVNLTACIYKECLYIHIIIIHLPVTFCRITLSVGPTCL